MHLTNMGPRALLVPPAMEEDAKTTSATKVRKSHRERERETEVDANNSLSCLDFCFFYLRAR